MWTTTNNIELAIITVILSIYFVGCTILVIQLIKFMKSVQILTDKTERLVDNVESASKTIMQASRASASKFRFFRFLEAILDNDKKDKSEED